MQTVEHLRGKGLPLLELKMFNNNYSPPLMQWEQICTF